MYYHLTKLHTLGTTSEQFVLCQTSFRLLYQNPHHKMKILQPKCFTYPIRKNNLQQYVLENDLDRRSVIQKPIDHVDSLENFPHLEEEDLSNITCGSYQLRLSSSYIQEHIDEEADIFVHREDPGLIQLKLQSRHISSRKYTLWIQFNETQIIATYCKCRAGARVVGVCSHVAAVLWFLGFSRHTQSECSYGVQKWSDSLQDAAVIGDSDSDDSVCEE